ncbi:uncharacterized protein LOC144440268 [Glandiceps talaboti]
MYNSVGIWMMFFPVMVFAGTPMSSADGVKMTNLVQVPIGYNIAVGTPFVATTIFVNYRHVTDTDMITVTLMRYDSDIILQEDFINMSRLDGLSSCIGQYCVFLSISGQNIITNLFFQNITMEDFDEYEVSVYVQGDDSDLFDQVRGTFYIAEKQDAKATTSNTVSECKCKAPKERRTKNRKRGRSKSHRRGHGAGKRNNRKRD